MWEEDLMEEKVVSKKKKPTFLRTDWHKKIKFGKTVKKNRKWRAAKGRHNKIRLGHKGHPKRPRIGYGQNKALIPQIIRVENLTQLNSLKKGQEIILANIGKKKKIQLIEESNKKGLIILNKPKEKKNELSK
ncbi:MAG: eL32 family ribosomal protein [Candidatus Nanoarchaeia archaeon]|jgi:ribosomal protein L32E|nr:eL32 family ribosomal protein [Candidatus Nanoarchaeia archaeon]